MLVKDGLVVKLPAARVEELAGEGVGERFDPGQGRIQKIRAARLRWRTSGVVAARGDLAHQESEDLGAPGDVRD